MRISKVYLDKKCNLICTIILRLYTLFNMAVLLHKGLWIISTFQNLLHCVTIISVINYLFALLYDLSHDKNRL